MTLEIDRAADDQTTRPPRRRWSGRVWVAIAVLAGLAVGAVLWFEPHKILVDERVDEAVPTARPTPTSAPPEAGARGPGTTAAPAQPVEVASGDFVGIDHATSGTARVLELADGRRFVRIEGLETDNGPDLYVYLSANPAGGPEEAFDDQHANLGLLQGNIGNQNYELPPDVEPSDYASVVIWCDRFDSAFGAADLTASPT